MQWGNENMVNRWEDREKVRTSINSGGLWGHVCWFLGLIFAILGVISDVMDKALGLTSTSWFSLAIVVSLLGIPLFIGWAVAWYLESKSKE